MSYLQTEGSVPVAGWTLIIGNSDQACETYIIHVLELINRPGINCKTNPGYLIFDCTD